MESSATSGSIRELGRYRSFLRLQALGMVNRFNARIEASDLVQQTLLDAHRRIDQFRGRSGAEMARWLAQILANNIADAARALNRQKRDVRREQRVENDRGGTTTPVDRWLAADQTTPSLNLHRVERIQQLQQALTRLPENQQLVIRLHHLQGLTLAETAERAGCTRAAVAGLLYRALNSLRSHMDPQAHGE